MYFRSVCLLQSFANKKWRANALAWLVFPMSQHFVFLINVSFWMRILGQQDFEIHGLLKCWASRYALMPMLWCQCLDANAMMPWCWCIDAKSWCLNGHPLMPMSWGFILMPIPWCQCLDSNALKLMPWCRCLDANALILMPWSWCLDADALMPMPWS